VPQRPFPTERGLKARRLFRRSGLLSPVALSLGGYLVQEGWFRTFRTGHSIDRNGDPLPWYSYPCKAFLEDRITNSMRVFEYGSGMSSRWFAARVASVISVEHDGEWAATVRRDLPTTCTILLEPDIDAYLGAIAGRGPFEIVVVDGLERPRAAAAALDSLTNDGVIVWDNSDWPDFANTFPLLQEHGFRQLGFTGLGPISRACTQTSVLYRTENCLGI
jgi:hypothetical protein